MLPLMMLGGLLLDKVARRLDRSPFRMALAAGAGLAPQAMVSYAAAAAADAVARAQIVAEGSERIVLALLLALLLRQSHALKTRSLRSGAAAHPAALDLPVAPA